MIRGAVNARYEVVVRLRVRGPGGVELDIDTLVDTGFNSSLVLSAKTVAALGLVRQSGGTATLADGSVRQFEIYSAEVQWGPNWRNALVSVVGNESLMGMGLLAGHRLNIDVAPGGMVEILPLP